MLPKYFVGKKFRPVATRQIAQADPAPPADLEGGAPT